MHKNSNVQKPTHICTRPDVWAILTLRRAADHLVGMTMFINVRIQNSYRMNDLEQRIEIIRQ
jgi:hypothetical protein